MLSTTETIWGLIILVIQGFTSYQRRSYIGFIIPVLTSIVYLVFQYDAFFILLVAEFLLHAVTRIAYRVIQASQAKKRMSALDKMRVKDLR